MALLLVMACAPNQSGTSRETPSENPSGTVVASAEPTPEPEPARTLRWRLEPGDRWEEDVTEHMFILEHPKGTSDPTQPSVITTKTERFEVVDVAAEQIRLKTTVVHYQYEVRREGGHVVFRSGQAPTAPLTPDAAREMSFIDVPLEMTMTPLGTVERVHDTEARHAEVLARFETLAPTMSTEDLQRARDQLASDLELQAPRLVARGIRPLLPDEPATTGSRWIHSHEFPSLFDSTVRYEVTYEVKSSEDGELQAAFSGEGVMVPTLMMKTIMADSDLRLDGTMRIDVRRGILLEHRETNSMRVELRDNPITGDGGVIASRFERMRVRRETAKPTDATQ
ncbi:MAG: DUF6263 family protein [Myxococcota bacterium]